MSAVWGNLFFCQGLNPKFGVKPNLEGFFPTKQAIRLQLVDMVSYHSRIKMTMDEKEEHKQKSLSVECMEVSSRYQQTTCSRYPLINWSSPWFTVTIDSEIATKAGCHVPYQLPMVN